MSLRKYSFSSFIYFISKIYFILPITCKTLWKFLLTPAGGWFIDNLDLQICVNICKFVTISRSLTPGNDSIVTTWNPSGGWGSIKWGIWSTSWVSSTYKKLKQKIFTLTFHQLILYHFNSIASQTQDVTRLLNWKPVFIILKAFSHATQCITITTIYVPIQLLYEPIYVLYVPQSQMDGWGSIYSKSIHDCTSILLSPKTSRLGLPSTSAIYV